MRLYNILTYRDADDNGNSSVIPGQNTRSQDRRKLCLALEVTFPCYGYAEYHNSCDKHCDDVCRVDICRLSTSLAYEACRDSQGVRQPRLSWIDCDSDRNSRTNPPVNSNAPSQSIRLSSFFVASLLGFLARKATATIGMT
jgi:hypothetical protein